jgi:phosphoglycolate phosphatase-like HAD superfamily hydrolase
MQNIQAYIFDFDWVIIDTPKKYAEIFSLVCLKMWRKITTEEAQYYSKSKNNFEEYFQDESERKIAYKLYQEIEKEHFPFSETPLVKWVKDKLEEIQNLDKKITIFTDRTKKSLEEALEVHSLGSFIDLSRTLCCTWEKKPSPKWLFEIMNFYSIQSQNCLFLWDSDVDKNASLQAKVPFIWVLSWVNSKDDWWDAQYIPDISHLKVSR